VVCSYIIEQLVPKMTDQIDKINSMMLARQLVASSFPLYQRQLYYCSLSIC